MLQARFLLIVVLLVWFGILNASAQVDSGRIVPRNKWPVDAHPVNNPTPWIPLNRARTIRYGVVLGDTARAQVFAAGIDLADQPTGNAIPSDTDFTSPGPLLDPKAHVQW